MQHPTLNPQKFASGLFTIPRTLYAHPKLTSWCPLDGEGDVSWEIPDQRGASRHRTEGARERAPRLENVRMGIGSRTARSFFAEKQAGLQTTKASFKFPGDNSVSEVLDLTYRAGLSVAPGFDSKRAPLDLLIRLDEQASVSGATGTPCDSGASVSGAHVKTTK